MSYAAFAQAVSELRQIWEADETAETAESAQLEQSAPSGPARIIALALPGGIPAALAWLAALTGGHRLVPCAPEASDDERLRLGWRQRPDVLVVGQTAEAAAFGRPNALVFTADDLYALADRAANPVERPTPLAPAREGTVRLTTSGTTGEPKGVVLSARQIAWTADQVRLSHQLTPEDRGLCVLPFFHINAPVVSLCATLLAGGCVVIAPRFSRHQFWEWVERERITWASIVPTIVALLLTTEKPAFLPGTLRFARSASAPLPRARHQAFEARFGVPLIETYGLSEAASQITANPLPPAPRKSGSVGLPTGVELRICKPLGDNAEQSRLCDLPHGKIGEICARGPNMIASYEDEVGMASFANGWFRTGDLGYLDDEGYLFITGRLREVINRGGEKIAPREIEELLLAHPAVSDAAVVGKPDPLYGQRVVAYVTLHGVWDAQQMEGELRAWCSQRLSAYKIPEAFYTVAALPRNGNGKLNRQALNDMRAEPVAHPQPTELPASQPAAHDSEGQRMLAHG